MTRRTLATATSFAVDTLATHNDTIGFAMRFVQDQYHPAKVDESHMQEPQDNSRGGAAATLPADCPSRKSVHKNVEEQNAAAQARAASHTSGHARLATNIKRCASRRCALPWPHRHQVAGLPQPTARRALSVRTHCLASSGRNPSRRIGLQQFSSMLGRRRASSKLRNQQAVQQAVPANRQRAFRARSRTMPPL